MTNSQPRHRFEDREELLHPSACRSSRSRGRDFFEPPCPLRTEFQRDRDRILHSKAFRRLKHKTQVFIAPLGDHYVTRLTHTLEVSQIARTICRALDLNEDLVEAMAMGHDLGHTPFGHIGEDELNKLLGEGFKHSHQSLRIVERLEKRGQGLNLTWEARNGIVNHSKPREGFLEDTGTAREQLTLEAHVCRIADAVAYLNHDLADAFRAGILEEDCLPGDVVSVLGSRHSERINTMVTDIVENSKLDLNSHTSMPISMSPKIVKAVNTLRDFLFERVYIPEDRGEEGQAARCIVRVLFEHLSVHTDTVPSEFRLQETSPNQFVVDYLAGMTDQFALRLAEDIHPGISKPFRSRLV